MTNKTESIKKTKVLKTFIRFNIELNPEQKEAKQTILDNKITVLRGKAGSGKSLLAVQTALDLLFKKEVEKIIITRPAVTAGEDIGHLPGPQPLWAKVLTPYGWKTMGELKVGEKVINKEGKTSKILSKSEESYEDIYKITLTDGRITHCSINHLFFTSTYYNEKNKLNPKYKKKGEVRSLKEIIETLYTKKGKINHYIPYNSPVEFSKIIKHKIHPYVLGCLLGDGCFHGSINLSSGDKEIIEKCQELVYKDNITLKKYGNSHYFCFDDFVNARPSKEVIITNINTDLIETYSEKYKAVEQYKINPGTLHYRCLKETTVNGLNFKFGKVNVKSVNPIKNEIIRLGLMETRANNKFIPKDYMYCSSIEDRLELLRGLMDTDGSINHTCATFTTCSEQLREDIIELVRSLGGKATYTTIDKRGQSFYSEFHKDYIKHNFITYEVWINMDYNPFNLQRKSEKYNPKFKHSLGIKNVEKMGQDYVQCIRLESEDGLYITDDYIITHNSKDDKLAPYIAPLYEGMVRIYSKELIDKRIQEGVIEVIPLGFIRGVNFSNCVVVVDEAQNITSSQMQLLLGRLCTGAKMILCGDMAQVDLKDKKQSGFDFICKYLKDIPGFSVVTLLTNHRDPIVEEILKIYDQY